MTPGKAGVFGKRTFDWLTKTQAAEALGVSTKTIEKLAEEGTIQKQTWRRTGKPAIAVYHPDDIQREHTKRNPE